MDGIFQSMDALLRKRRTSIHGLPSSPFCASFIDRTEAPLGGISATLAANICYDILKTCAKYLKLLRETFICPKTDSKMRWRSNNKSNKKRTAAGNEGGEGETIESQTTTSSLNIQKDECTRFFFIWTALVLLWRDHLSGGEVEWSVLWVH